MSNKLLNLLIFRSLHTSGSTTLSVPTLVFTGLLNLSDWFLHVDFNLIQILNITYPFQLRTSFSPTSTTNDAAQFIAECSENATALVFNGSRCLLVLLLLRLVGIIPRASYAFEGAADFVHGEGGDGGGGGVMIWEMSI